MGRPHSSAIATRIYEMGNCRLTPPRLITPEAVGWVLYWENQSIGFEGTGLCNFHFFDRDHQLNSAKSQQAEHLDNATSFCLHHLYVLNQRQ